ncbi:MAG: hypothetical protein NVS9B1_20900 [Candidatus Dormibacteraceae bacterium]
MKVVIVKAVRVPVTAPEVRGYLLAAVALMEVGARLPGADWTLTVRLCGDREIRVANQRFRGEDHATDVLSFPSGETGPGAYIGDLLISWPATLRQAAEHGHPPQSELALLCVHGLLHLLGWDHANPAEEAEMGRLTRAALSVAGRSIAPGRI